MKKINSILAGMLLTASVCITQQATAQAPQKMSYQSVLRNSSNALLANTQVRIKISVLQGIVSDNAVYTETQTATTNANGLVSIQIGTGDNQTGTFAGIDWSAGPYFIKTETDPAGGTNYTITGIQEMLSVPYALYAAKSGDATTMGAVGASSNANGATLTSGILSLTPADASNGGIVTTGEQTFAGAKIFSSDVVINGTPFGTNGIPGNVTIGANAGQTAQAANSVAIGNAAGQFRQGHSAVAMGNNAGNMSQGNSSVAMGNNAGNMSQGNSSVAMGNNAGNYSQGLGSVAMGNNAGNMSQGNSSVAIGNAAGQDSQGQRAVAMGDNAGQDSQGQSAVAMGNNAGNYSQGIYSVAMGSNAGEVSQGQSAVAMGSKAGQDSQGQSAVAMGNNAGQVRQGQSAVAMGNNAGNYSQGLGSVAMGEYAGFIHQGIYSVAMGNNAGHTDQGNSSVAIGNAAGSENQAPNSIILNASGAPLNNSDSGLFIKPIRNDASSIVPNVLSYDTISGEVTYSTGAATSMGSIGASSNPYGATLTSGVLSLTPADATNGGVVTTGEQTFAGAKIFSSDVVINGTLFGNNGNPSNVTIGANAGQDSQGQSAVAMGSNAGKVSQGDSAVAMGSNAGEVRQGQSAVAMGSNAGQDRQGQSAVAMGNNAGNYDQGLGSVAIGNNAGRIVQGQSAVAMGDNAGFYSQGNSSVAIGNNAGYRNQAANSVAIGNAAGSENQAANSIILNASGAALNNSTSGLFIKPIRNAASSNVLSYDPISGEVTHSTGGSVIFSPTGPPTNGMVVYKYFQNNNSSTLYDDGKIRIRLNLGVNKLYLTNVDSNLSNIWSSVGSLSSSFGTSMDMAVGNGYFQNFGTSVAAVGTEVNVYSNLTTSGSYVMSMNISAPDNPSFGLYVINFYFNAPLNSTQYSSMTVNYYKDPSATP